MNYSKCCNCVHAVRAAQYHEWAVSDHEKGGTGNKQSHPQTII